MTPFKSALLATLFISRHFLFAADQPPTTPDVTSPQPDTNTAGMSEGIRRWLDLNTLSFSFRDRNEYDSDGYYFFQNGQQRSLIDGAFKIDSQGKYAIHFHVSSGRTFNWAFSDEVGPDFLSRIPGTFATLTPLQLAGVYSALAADPQASQIERVASRGWEMYFRELYFSATPIKQLTLEFGSLGIERGAGTEATTYDDDGYISGERLRIHDSAHLYADEISFTSAYEGDILQPNFFNRAERLGQSNYRQIMAEKHFGSRLNTSADYTFDKGTHTIREAAHLKVPELKAIDGIRVELYQRVNNYLLEGQTFYAHQGAAVTLSRTIRKSFQIEGGYADVDPDYGVLTGSRVMAAVGFSMNGDAYLTGQRLFTRANWKVTPYISLFGYYTHELVVPVDYLQVNKQSLNYGATIDFKNILTKLHVL